MCLKQKSTIIEKACKEINRSFLSNRKINHITCVTIYKDEAEPVVKKVCDVYNLNYNYIFKILDIR